jgi:hypothetical protein
MSPRVIPVGEEPPPMDDYCDADRNRRQADATNGRHRSNGDRNGPAGKHDSRGRFQCVNAFIDVTMAALNPTERATWMVLWRDTKPNGLAETSQASLASRAGVTDRAVRKALKGLQGRGLVTIVRRGSLRRGASVYRVHPITRGL